MTRILYNPKASNGQGLNKIEDLKQLLTDKALAYHNILEIEDLPAFFASLPEEDEVYLCGGDGTLNRFVNLIGDYTVRQKLFLYGSGSGNDFLHDVIGTRGPIQINRYIEGLPTVEIDGKVTRFINGIGYGIDGYCCEEGDRQQAADPGKTVNYTAIAIKGLLFHYKPVGATVTVDGESRHYKKVWLAPAMNGRYYGGGMMVAPAQERLSEDGRLTSVVMYGSGKFKTLAVFPSIFKGEHVQHTEMVEVRRGREITVEFDTPTALQIDGETVRQVRRYTARAGHGQPASPLSDEALATAEEPSLA